LKKETGAIAIFVSVVDWYRWLNPQNHKETDRDRGRGRGRERCRCMLCRLLQRHLFRLHSRRKPEG
jgi:hypothetical protein